MTGGGRLSIAAVKSAVAAHFGVSPEALTSRRRAAQAARDRHVGIYLARRLTDRSNGQIARQFGRGHPSTVIHAVNKIEALRVRDPETCAAIRAIEAVLTGESGR